MSARPTADWPLVSATLLRGVNLEANVNLVASISGQHIGLASRMKSHPSAAGKSYSFNTEHGAAACQSAGKTRKTTLITRDPVELGWHKF